MRICLAAFLLVPALASGQRLPSLEEGTPIAETYSWLDYGASNQNWATVQDDRGILFVANTDGVLEYDGETWRTHALPDSVRLLVRSLAVGKDGTVYVGGVGVLGRLRADASNSLTFESLTENVPEADRDFGDVWTTFSTSSGIVFQTPSRLFRWDGTQMEVWTTETRFHKAFQVEGDVIVREESVGLRRLGARGLNTLPGGGGFADRKVFALMAHPRGLLAAVVDEGLVVLSQGRETALEGVASAYLRSFRPYAGLSIENAYEGGDVFAIATLGGGVLVVDGNGGIVRVYRDDVGLDGGDFVVGMETDLQGGLWLALLNGVVRVELFGRVTQFSSEQGIRGQGYGAIRHQGILYAATAAGVFRLVPGALGALNGQPRYTSFEQIAEEVEQAWTLTESNGDLLIGANDGVYQLQGDRAQKIQESQSVAFHIREAVWDPTLLLVGMKDGIGVLRHTQTGWRDEGYVEGIEGEVRSFSEDASGQVWAGLIGGGVARLQPNDRGGVVAEVFDEGLTGGTVVTGAEGEVLVSSLSGVHRIVADGSAVRFEIVPGLAQFSGVFSLFQRASGGVWVVQNGEMIGGRIDGDQFIEEERLRFKWTQVLGIREDPNGVMWLSTDSGLLRYDPRIGTDEKSYPAFVRRVADGRRETLYGGALPLAATRNAPTLVLPFAENALRFEFAAASFAHPGLMEYQTWLVGQQDEWSPWGRETIADYTNLPEGEYTFRVRARDVRGRLSEEAVFVLRVLPPWYRTVWAYLSYVLGAIVLIWLIVASQVRKHRRKLAAQRVRNVRAGRLNSRLQDINHRLRQADKLKDDLLANTSHELRTPLTAILGYAELLVDEADEEMRPLAEGVWRGGNRLLSTVNSLLDMYKLQSGTLNVFPVAIDAAEQARETVRMLQPLATEKGLALGVFPSGIPIPAEVDPGMLDRILTNLVGNAIKFTNEGSVTVLVDSNDEQLWITVKDSGCGIDAEFLPRLFQPFEQESTGHGRSHEGTGLGLAIVRRVVDLCGGTIAVESKVDVGTTFRVTLPITTRATPISIPEIAPPAALGGAEVLAVTQEGPLATTLKGIVEPYGKVTIASSVLRSVREAKRHAYDLVFVEATEGKEELRRVEAIRRVPGYEQVAIIRTGGDPLSKPDLEIRGFTHQIQTIDDETVIFGLLEGLLMKMDAAPVE